MRVTARFVLLGALFLGQAASATWVQAGVPVYIMSSGDLPTDEAVADALSARGHLPTLGVPFHQWDGNQATLEDFQAVVLLNSYNYTFGSMPVSGQAALLNYVANGGGVVTGEWLIWAMDVNLWHKDLEPMMPADNPDGTFSGPGSTTYTAVTPDATIGNGLPDSFEFPRNNLAGSESNLVARPEATVFFSSSAAAGAPGLVGRDFGTGRVASFSTLLTAVELSNPNYETLFVNSVEWVAGIPGPCLLKLTAALSGSDLTLNFKLGTPTGATWNSFLLYQAEVIRLWSAPLPAIHPSVEFPVPIPNFPALGKIGFLTTLTDSGGIQCSDLAMVDTGTAEAVPTPARLRELFQR